jgi:ATP-dependent Lhr-like helicase
LAVDESSERWSKRANERLSEIRQEFSWLQADSTVAMLAGGGQVEWWTFGGIRPNATLARALAVETSSKVSHDSFTLTLESAIKLQDVERAIEAIRQQDVANMRPAVDEAAIDGLKFSECLPIDLAIQMLERRLQEPLPTRQVLDEHVRFVLH